MHNENPISSTGSADCETEDLRLAQALTALARRYSYTSGLSESDVWYYIRRLAHVYLAVLSSKEADDSKNR